MNLSLGTKTFIGLVLGLIAGFILGPNAEFLKPVGDIFIRLLQMVVLPLVIATITSALFQSDSLQSFGKIAGKTIIYFLGCTLAALCIGIVVAQIIQPGQGYLIDVTTLTFKVPPPVGFSEMILGLFSANIFTSLSTGRILEVIVFSLFLGYAIRISGEKGLAVRKFFESFSDVMISFVHIVVRLAPYGVFCLIAPIISKYGLSVLLPLISIIAALAIAAFLHAAIVYTAVLKFNKISLSTFFKSCSPAIVMAFSSCSSAAALPFSFKAQEDLGVSKKVRNFVLPLGMTVNMDGTALYLSIAATFVANVYGIELTMTHIFTIVASGLLGSIGTAAIPMGGLIMLTLVLSSTGLPVEGLALVAGIDRVLDMFRTTLNVLGDNVVSIAVAKSENEIEQIASAE